MNRRVISNNVIFADVRRLISEGKEITMHAKGNSMLPFIICESDTILLTPISEIKVGEIVLAHISTESRYVIHRIVEIDNEQVTLMGDGNIQLTESCRRSDLIARVSKIYRGKITFNCDSQLFGATSWLWRRALPLRSKLLRLFSISRRLLRALTPRR